MRCRGQEQLLKNMKGGLNLDQFKLSFEELSNNSKHISEMMIDQNKIVQNTFSLMEEILNSLKTFSKDMEILRYRGWIKKLINEIVIKLNNEEGIGGSDAWRKISRAFSNKIDNNKVDFRRSEMQYILDITLEEFESLMRLKSNHLFHKGSLQMSNLKHFLKI
jgi:hypothetical protein